MYYVRIRSELYRNNVHTHTNTHLSRDVLWQGMVVRSDGEVRIASDLLQPNVVERVQRRSRHVIGLDEIEQK